MSRRLALLAALLAAPAAAADGNRLAYLDTVDPYYPSLRFPKLVTPQWVGEKDVEAVVVLAIDDMRGSERWERYLRPILRRLQKIDGRAPVSIMTCSIDPKDPHLQTWLKEGLSLETHTVEHPCPILGKGGLASARSTYDRCIDLLASVPGNRPVAFRTPCCDSMNTPSPRLFAEVFARTTPKGHFLTIDSSVFNLTTPDDPELPRDLVFDAAGRDRFRKYLPADRRFVNFIRDYPYPYVVGNRMWQFPCATPSDWQGRHLHGDAHPTTLADMKAGLDAAVRKQGVWCLVFHPYAWIRPDQVVDLIDHAVRKHGKKVKFLTFREAQERLDKHLLAGHPLRDTRGQENGVRLLDVDGDGYQDVVIGNADVRKTRVWDPRARRWVEAAFPARVAGAHFGVLRAGGQASALFPADAGLWHFDGKAWRCDPAGLTGLELEGKRLDRGVRLRDIDGDGVCELVVGNPMQNAVFAWSEKDKWRRLPYRLPAGMSIVDADGNDAGLRFADVDEDGRLDVLFANEEQSSFHLFADPKKGWSIEVLAAKRGAPGGLPAISWRGTNNGAFFHDRRLIVVNERTALLPGLSDTRPFNDLLAAVEPGPKSPAASLRCLRPRPGFVAELVAAEPLVMDPIAFAWGADGRLWVVEMGDYPMGIDGKGKPGGRVVCLHDRDGDGRYDTRTVFLDGLGFPTGVLPWRKGVLVTCAPDILYAEDTKGTGKADRVEKLFTGFREGNQQHRVNTLAWGLDNWVYVANGDSGGRIRSAKTGKTIDISGRDLRVRPDTGEMDAQTGQTQFGRSRDDHGNWFGGNNSVPMWHYVLPDHYLRRNSHFAAPTPRVEVPAVPGTAPIFPISRTLPRFNDLWAANRFTSACSPIVYRDELFGSHFSRSLFVCEPVHNLVHRQVLTPAGVTFRGRRADDERDSEFLASSDSWFRPTMVQTGPDGALYVADMYRHVIEHPQWIPPETQKKLDLRAGHDRGRIYRVYPVGARPRAVPRLDRLDTAGLVAALDSPSGWQRDTAHMLLLWRNDRKAVPALEKVARSARPLARLHALCVLDGLSALPPELLAAALADGDAAVRRHAVRLCEGRLPGSLAPALLKRVEDDDANVRLQLAFTLGAWADERAGKALGQLLRRDHADPWRRAAALTSLTRANLAAVIDAALDDAPPAGLIASLLRQAAAMKHDGAVVTLTRRLATWPAGEAPGWRLDVLAGLLDDLDSRGSSLARLGKEGGKELRAALDGLEPLFAHARKTAGATETERLRAVRLLGRGIDRQKEDRDLLGSLLNPAVPPAVQAAAVAALARLGSADVPGRLLRGWKGHAPTVRVAVLDALLARPAWAAALLDAIEGKRVLPLELDAARRQRLLGQRDPALRQRAAKLFTAGAAPDRQKLIAAYLAAAKKAGDATRGREVFVKSCAACHKVGGVGHDVGPSLAALAGRPADYLLTAILDPNRAVEARYLSYTATLADGRVVVGAVMAETATSVTLTGPDGKAQTVLRKNLESLIGTGQSLMPEGIDKDVAPAAMADLLAFLRSAAVAAKPKAFPGNRPEVVRAGADGVLRLTALNAEIHGPNLVLETGYRNLGHWTHADDRAVWSVEVPRAGAYEVWLEHACDRAAAGNTFVLDADTVLLTAKVASTGSWERYRDLRFGTVKLPAGKVRLTMRSQGAIRGALVDLRTVRLVPVK